MDLRAIFSRFAESLQGSSPRASAITVVMLAAGFLGTQDLQAAVPPPTSPARVTLAWDASTSTDVIGYNVYYGTAPGSYSKVVNAGPNTTVVITNLTRGITYYFSATAIDRNGLESDFSQEISHTPPLVVTPHMTLSRQPSGAMVLTATGVPGTSYGVLVSEDIKGWINLSTTVAGPNGEILWTDNTAPNFKKRFYRLLQLTP